MVVVCFQLSKSLLFVPPEEAGIVAPPKRKVSATPRARPKPSATVTSSSAYEPEPITPETGEGDEVNQVVLQSLEPILVSVSKVLFKLIAPLGQIKGILGN